VRSTRRADQSTKIEHEALDRAFARNVFGIFPQFRLAIRPINLDGASPGFVIELRSK